MTRVLVQLTLFAALAPAALNATSLRLCLQNDADVSVPARAELLRELIRLFPGVGLADSKRCAEDEDAVQIALTQAAAEHPADALGAMKVRQGRIAPPALVFVDQVAHHSRASGERALGRALARVAGHELLHFLRQTQQHEDQGLMRDKLTAHDLTRNPGPPAWTVRDRDRRSGR